MAEYQEAFKLFDKDGNGENGCSVGQLGRGPAAGASLHRAAKLSLTETQLSQPEREAHNRARLLQCTRPSLALP
jgi:hypothetical protein